MEQQYNNNHNKKEKAENLWHLIANLYHFKIYSRCNSIRAEREYDDKIACDNSF